MRVSLEIPEDLGRRIVTDPGELPRAALEGLPHGQAYGFPGPPALRYSLAV